MIQMDKIDSFLGIWPTIQCFCCPGCNGRVYFGNNRYLCGDCGLPISLWLAQRLIKASKERIMELMKANQNAS